MLGFMFSFLNMIFATICLCLYVMSNFKIVEGSYDDFMLHNPNGTVPEWVEVHSTWEFVIEKGMLGTTYDTWMSRNFFIWGILFAVFMGIEMERIRISFIERAVLALVWIAALFLAAPLVLPMLNIVYFIKLC